MKSIVMWDPCLSRISSLHERLSFSAFSLVYSLYTCSSQARPISLLLHPFGDELTKASCFPAWIPAVQEDWIVELAEAKRSPGGRKDPLPQIHANKVIHSWFPSWRASLTSLLSYIALLKILLLLPITPIRKPFSSILYKCWGCILYSLIFSSRSWKNSRYLSSESALCRSRSIPAVQCDSISFRCRLINRVT